MIFLAGLYHARHDQPLERRFGALPFTLTIETDRVVSRDEFNDNIKPLFATGGGRIFQFVEHNLPQHDRWSWQFTQLTSKIEIDISPGYVQRLAGLHLRVGGRTFPVNLSDPEKTTRDGRAVFRYRVILPEGELRRSGLFPGAVYVNWPGDTTVLWRLARFIGIWGGLFALVVVAAGSKRFRRLCDGRLRALLNQQQEERGPRPGRMWFWPGLAVVIGTLATLQWRDPFYFAQDDNFSQFLPIILAGGDSFFRGMLFDYNPYQLLGMPTVEIGTYALTYPGTYVAFALARLAGNQNLTIEIFCMGHLLLGFAATWWAVRRWGGGAPLAAALGVCFVLSGYALVAGRSWYYMTPLFFWLPLALGALHGVLFRERKIGCTVLLAASLGLLFHAGNAQMWVYTAGFVGLLALAFWLREGHSRRSIIHLSGAGLTALALAMPLFLLQVAFAAQAERAGGTGYSVVPSLTSLFLPLPLDATDMNFGFSPVFRTGFGPLNYSGPFWIPAGLLLAGIALAEWLGGKLGQRPISTPALFALAGAAAFLLACGFDGPLWFMHAHLPALDKFTHPIKFLPFALLLLGLATAVGWEQLGLSPRMKGRVAAAFALCAMGLMTWNAMRTDLLAFRYYADDPYPGARQAVTAPRRYDARIFPMSALRSSFPGYTASNNLNFAMINGEISLWGYDPFIWTHPRLPLEMLIRDPIRLFQEFGVNRIDVWQEIAFRLPGVRFDDMLTNWQADIVARLEAGGVELPDLSGAARRRARVPVPGARPLAFAAADASRSWPVTVAGPRVTVDLGEGEWRGGEMVLSFLAWPRIVVTADGRKVPVRADKFGRVAAAVPEGTRKVALEYRIDWLPGLGVAVALLALAAYGVWRFDRPGRGRREEA